jgi:type II secretory pathway pseudopilin PulG
MIKFRKPKIWEIIVVIVVLIIIVAVLIPTGMFGTSQKTSELKVKNCLANLVSKQVQNLEDKKGFYSNDELKAEISVTCKDFGYAIVGESRSNHFEINATPTQYNQTGINSFYVDSSDGNIHGADNKGNQASRNNPIIENSQSRTKNVLDKIKINNN